MSGLLEDRTGIKARTPMPVQDVTSATSKSQITSEAVSFTDGSAGTTQRIKLTYDGVMSLYGERIGMDGDSSFSWGTGTVLTTEVPWRFKGTQGKDNETDRLASMANGEYMIDYENGYILGKNAGATSGSTDTATYKVRLQASSIVGGGDASAANQTLQLAQETAAATSLSTLDDWDEGDRAKVNLIPGQHGVSGGPGASDAGTVRVVLSTDSATGIADQTAFSVGVSKGSLIMAEADETGPDSVSEGDIGALRMTLTRYLKTSLGDLIAGEDQTNNLLQVAEKPVSVSTYTPDLDTSTAAEASSVTKNATGNLYAFTATNSSGSNRYLQFFNSTTVPADATVPVLSYFCAAGGSISEMFGKGRNFTTGIAWCWSSTAATKTIGSTDGIADVRYK